MKVEWLVHHKKIKNQPNPRNEFVFLMLLHEAFAQVCWTEKEKVYDHMEISAWKRIQRVLIEQDVINESECSRKVSL